MNLLLLMEDDGTIHCQSVPILPTGDLPSSEEMGLDPKYEIIAVLVNYTADSLITREAVIPFHGPGPDMR